MTVRLFGNLVTISKAWRFCKWTIGGSAFVGFVLPGALISGLWRYRQRRESIPKPSAWKRWPAILVLTPITFFGLLSMGSRVCEERVFALPEFVFTFMVS